MKREIKKEIYYLIKANIMMHYKRNNIHKFLTYINFNLYYYY